MDLELLQKELYKILSTIAKTYADSLPLKDINENELNYVRNTYITYSLKNIEDLGYKDSILLDVEVVSGSLNKLKVQDSAIKTDLLLNRKWIESCNAKLVRSNIYFMPFLDEEEDKFVVTLSYKILKY